MGEKVDVIQHPMGRGMCLDVEGELSLDTFLHVRERVHQLLEAGPQLVAMRLDGISFLDTSGLGLLMGIHRRIQEHGGRLVLICKKPQHRQTLALTQVDRFVPVVDDVEDAMQVLGIEGDESVVC